MIRIAMIAHRTRDAGYWNVWRAAALGAIAAINIINCHNLETSAIASPKVVLHVDDISPACTSPDMPGNSDLMCLSHPSTSNNVKQGFP